MNPIFAAAEEIQAFCRARDWRFCFIGGLANQRWGEPRLTQDVDLTARIDPQWRFAAFDHGRQVGRAHAQLAEAVP